MRRKLKLTTLSSVNVPGFGVYLYGLDEKGNAWCKTPKQVWAMIDMEAEGCPECGCSKSNPKEYQPADGHGGLRVVCKHVFHLTDADSKAKVGD